MSDMKCPVCKTGNVKQGKYDKEYFCDNEFCPSYDETDSSTYDILIRTRKALEIAVDALDIISQITNQIGVCDTANDALNTIASFNKRIK